MNIVKKSDKNSFFFMGRTQHAVFSFFEEKIKNKFRNINFPKNTTLKEFFFKKNSDFSRAVARHLESSELG